MIITIAEGVGWGGGWGVAIWLLHKMWIIEINGAVWNLDYIQFPRYSQGSITCGLSVCSKYELWQSIVKFCSSLRKSEVYVKK